MKFIFYKIIMAFTLPVFSQQMNMESYNPKSTLVVKEHLIKKAKYPFVDIHNHQWDMPNQDLKALLADMNSLNMVVMVNLSGKSFDIFYDDYGGSTMHQAGVDKLNKS